MYAIDQDLEVISSRLLAKENGRNQELREVDVSPNAALFNTIEPENILAFDLNVVACCTHIDMSAQTEQSLIRCCSMSAGSNSTRSDKAEEKGVGGGCVGRAQVGRCGPSLLGDMAYCGMDGCPSGSLGNGVTKQGTERDIGYERIEGVRITRRDGICPDRIADTIDHRRLSKDVKLLF